jgi:hypothetical protein
MRVKFSKPLFVGVRTYAKGEVGEFTDEKAAEFVRDGYARPVKAGEKIETTTQPEPPLETATVKAEPKGT